MSPDRSVSALDVFIAFLRLGLTAFGGPIAHLAYFRREFVERRQWLSEGQYAQLLALSQFLPGPASSQLGFAIGLQTAGWLGAIAAFVAFTLPSAILLVVFAASLPQVAGPVGDAVIHGLKLVAVAVVAQAVLGMSRQFCADAVRASIAIVAVAWLLLAGSAGMQLAVIAFGAVAGMVACREVLPPAADRIRTPQGLRGATVLLALFALLLLGLPWLAQAYGGLWQVVEAFYRAGALVFGGGHVVLPLLETSVVASGWVSEEAFLAGYGAAQAVPGPMFAVAAYLGALAPSGQGGVLGASLALLAIFLPGFLLLAGFLPLWHRLSAHPHAARAIAGVNAAVVGILGAALYDPLFTSAVQAPQDLAIALVGFGLLAIWRVSALYVVLWCVAASLLAGLLLA